VDALISGTLYVFLGLGYFSSTEIELETTLIKRICEEAVSRWPNSSTLLDEVCKSFDEQEVWIERLLQVTNKQYLFLVIDEISDLTRANSNALSRYILRRPKGNPCLSFVFQDSF